MTTPHVPTLRQPPPLPTRHVGVLVWAVVAALLAIAAVTAVVLWQTTREEESAPPAAEAPALVPRLSATGMMPAVTPPVVVYVVGSPAQAEAMQAALAEADAIRAQLGEVPLLGQVTVVTDAQADTFFWMMGGQDAVRAELGLPSLTLVDLRP